MGGAEEKSRDISPASVNIPDSLDAEAAKKYVGEKFDQAKFDELASEGKITKVKLLELCPPVLHYFDISGRGELSKLIAAVGGVKIEVVEYPFKANGASTADKLKAGAMETEHTKAAKEMGMEGCGLPILVHGNLKINQSAAIQDYFCAIGPNYPAVTPAQKAVDNMFMGALEDLMGVGAGIVLSGGDPIMDKAMAKVLTHLTKYIPADGKFVNGFDSPTAADLVILMATQALIPFGATLGEGAKNTYEKFPAAVALGQKAAEFPAVAKWLTDENCCLKLPPREARK